MITRPSTALRALLVAGSAAALAASALAMSATASVNSSTSPQTPSTVRDRQQADDLTDPAVGFVLDRGRVRRIDLPGDGSFTVLGKSTDDGRIVGKAPKADGSGFFGFVLDRQGRFQRIDFPGATTTYAQGINERGWIVGDASPGQSVVDPGATGFLLRDGKYTRIAYPDAVYTQAFGVNKRGQVVGEYLDKDGRFHGYRWERGRFTSFDGPRRTGASFTDINDRGDIVGAYPINPANPLAGLRGFLLRNGRYTTFAALGLAGTLPFDINNRGQIAGTAISDPDFTEVHGFLLDKGARGPATQIDVPGAQRTTVYGIDDRGRLIGVYDNPKAVSAKRPRATQPDPMADAMPLGLASAG
jgi:hypothetical protein